ncbi:MAG TPA: FtsX-like permease family protein [Streptosporangiaceae bacterium]|nr:FtsX-like permease family protein [Streptosporangiaceae bacterium]
MIRHLIAHRLAFAVVLLTALITASFTAAAVTFLSAVTSGAAASELSGRPESVIGVTAPATHTTLDRVSTDLAGGVRGLLPGLRPDILLSSQSGVLNLPGRRSSLPGHGSAGTLQTMLISLPAFAAHAIQVSGHCFSISPGSSQAVPACLPESAAHILGLAPGDVVTLRESATHVRIRVLITGTFRRARPSSSYWLLDPLGAGAVQRAAGFTVAGPLVTSPAAMAKTQQVASVSLVATPDFGRMGGTGLAALGTHLATAVDNINGSGSLDNATITTGLPAELLSLATALVVARTKILAGMLALLVIGGATLALAARLLAERRAPETALIGARGASRTQVARRGLIDAVVVAAPVALAGPLLGAKLAPLLAHRLTSGLTGSAWLAATLVGAGFVAVIALPWLRRPESPLLRRARRGRQRSIAAAVYARADLAVVVLAGGAVWQLIHSAGPVSSGLDGTLSADPILVIAPVLALAGGALLTLRALPLAARLGDKLASRGRGLIVPVAAWQLSRRALREAGPTLLVVLAIAAAVMAVAQRDSWQRSVQAQAAFSVGADMRVTMPPAAPLPAGQVTDITDSPGVRTSTPAVRSQFSLPDGTLATLLALDARTAFRIIPAQAAGPSASMLRELAAVPQVGVVIPGRPAALRLTARLGPTHLGQPVLYVGLMDAAGIGYLLPAGNFPADGRAHSLTVMIAPQHRADYPLRLTGFTLQFNLPGGRRPAETLVISRCQALPEARSPQGTPFPATAAGRPLAFTASKGTGGTDPTAVRTHVLSGGALAATFKPGIVARLFGLQGVPTSSAGVSVAESYQGNGRPLAAVVTRSMLTGSGLRIGSRLNVSIEGTDVPVIAVAAVSNLPTVAAGSAGVLIDQRALADFLQASGVPPPVITEWWLRTSRRPTLSGLPPGTSTALWAGLAGSLLADPLALASQQALLASAVAAVLLALIGMLVSVATASERARDLALLDALGMPPGHVARLLAAEQAIKAVVTSVIGLLFGVALSKLIVPAVTLTAQAARPVPPLVVQVPWLTAAIIAVVMAAVPTLAIMLTVPGSGSGAAITRLEGEA